MSAHGNSAVPPFRALSREPFNLKVALEFSAAIRTLDHEKLSRYMDVVGEPNQKLVVPTDGFGDFNPKSGRGSGFCFATHPLTYLLIDQDYAGPSQVPLILCIVELLRLNDRHNLASMIDYDESNAYGLMPADYAAICDHTASGAQVIVDCIKQRGLRRGKDTPVFIPRYEILYLVSNKRGFIPLAQNAHDTHQATIQLLESELDRRESAFYKANLHMEWLMKAGRQASIERMRLHDRMVGHLETAHKTWAHDPRFGAMGEAPSWARRRATDEAIKSYKDGMDPAKYMARVASTLRP